MPNCRCSYEPQEDSTLLESHVRELASGRVLDMGTGSGIQAIAAAHAERVESVVAADIQKGTIEYCKAAIQNRKIRFLVSDLFSAFRKGGKPAKKFNTILFNPPYLPSESKEADAALEGGKHGYEVIGRFLREANDYLDSEGIILLLFSSLTKKDKVDAFIRENLFESELLESRHFFFEDLFVYKILKTPLLKEISHAGISSLRFHAKGKRGLVYSCSYEGKKAALKTANPSSKAIGKIKHEAEILRKVNKAGIGPRLLFSADRCLVEQFIDGELIGDFIESSSKAAIKKTIKEITAQMMILDTMRITKEEMHRPHKHIIVAKGMPVLIDFERAHYAPRPGNLTQFCQYLTSTALSGLLQKKSIKIDKGRIIGLAKSYKNAPSAEKKRKAFLAIAREICSA